MFAGSAASLIQRSTIKMIGKALIIAILAAAAQAKDIKSICAVQITNELWPHETNCSQFYNCANGVPVTQSCAPGTNFNDKIQVCDWPQNVNCNRSIVDDEEYNEEEEAVSRCGPSDSEGLQLPHRNCYQFYKCSHGIPYPFDCSANLLYNIKMEVCDWADSVDCGTRFLTRTTTTQAPATTNKVATASSSILCAFKGADGFLLPHDEDCKFFYKCINGESVLLSCPNGMSYDKEKKRCGWTSEVNCKDRTAKLVVSENKYVEDTSFHTVALKTCADPNISTDGLMLPHDNCTKFYECIRGVPELILCYPTMVFNIEMKRCDWPENVDCGMRKTSPVTAMPERYKVITTQDPLMMVDYEADAVKACAANNSEGLLLPHSNCHEFYECAMGRLVVLVCPEDLVYNIATKRCDWSDNVNCGDRTPRRITPAMLSSKQVSFNRFYVANHNFDRL